jgi:hypothetical protein
MSKDQEIDLSTIAASNTDFGGTGVGEGMPPSDVNNAMRYLAKMRADAITRHVAKSTGSYTALKTDHNQFWRCTGAVTINLTAAATLTSGWCLWVRANGGAVTIDPNGSEQIDGGASLILADGQSCLIICTGSTFFTEFWSSSPAAAKQQTGFLFGLTLSNNGADAVNDIDIAAGSARDSNDVDTMVLASAMTKRLDANWAVGTNQGGLDAGSIADATYHVWLVKRPDTGGVDALFSTSATAPTMPANYMLKRRIGSIVRAGGTIQAFRQSGDHFRWDQASVDVNVNNPGTGAIARTLFVPAGIAVDADIVVEGANGTSNQYFVLVTALDETDRAPSISDNQLVVGTDLNAGTRSASPLRIKTNSSRQVRSRQSLSGASDNFRIICFGYIDTRGRLA